MSTALVVYWSGTGNTEAMARAVAAGIEEGGAAVRLVPVEKATQGDVAAADLLALGCPSMGDEVLEESDMEPFVASLGPKEVQGKPLVLFGSYDWGDGAWMRDWEARMKDLGAVMAAPGHIVQLEPGPGDLAACRSLGATLTRT